MMSICMSLYNNIFILFLFYFTADYVLQGNPCVLFRLYNCEILISSCYSAD